MTGGDTRWRGAVLVLLCLGVGCASGDNKGSGGDDAVQSTDDTGDIIIGEDGVGVGDDGATTVVEHCGKIDSDETWGGDVLHQVTCVVEVRRGTLTVDAGAIVIFDSGAGLEVGTDDDEASLLIQGSEGDPVQLRTEEAADPAGFWKGVRVGKNGVGVHIQHTRISRGGTDLRAGLSFNGSVGIVEHVTIEGAGQCGLELSNGGSLDSMSTHLTITESGVPVCTVVESLHTLPSEGSSYTGNTIDYVEITGEDVTESVVWENLGVPYAFTKQVKVAGTAASPAIIEIGPGTELQFANNKGIKLATGGGAAGLHARGTESEPVRFTAMGAQVPGSWGGIETALGTLPGEFSLTHTRVEYAGGALPKASVYAYAADVKLEHVDIADGLQAGLGFRKGGRLVAGSDHISVTGCEEALLIEPDAVGDLYDVDIDLVGNIDNTARLSVASADTPVVSGVVRWRDLGVPYYAESGLRVEGSADLPAELTIEAGVTIRFDSNKVFAVGRSGAGTLHVEGESDSPVRFLPYTASIPGSWAGLEFAENALGTSTLQHFEIDYAGGSTNDGALDVLWGDVTADNGVIRYSDGCGVYLHPDRGSLAISNMTFVDSSGGDICGDVVER